MGFHISWIATKGIEKNEVLKHFELESTGEFDAVPDSEWSFLDIQNGWNVFIWNEPEVLDTAAVKFTSDRTDAEAVTAVIVESAMVCACSGWKGGKKLWSVSHDSNHGLTHLDFEGALPPSFETVRSECEKAQADTREVDYFFDVPIKVAHSICGFQHDQCPDSSLGDSPFEMLRSLKPKVANEAPPLSEKQKKALAHATKISKGRDTYEKRIAAGLSGYSPKKKQTLVDIIRSFFTPKG